MRKIGLALLFGVSMVLMAYVSAERLYEWYQTGQLAMHRKMPLGPDVVTYASDPVGFLMELSLYLFLFVMGTFVVLVACRDALFRVSGQSFFDLRHAHANISIFNLLLTLFLLAVFAFGVLQKLVWR